MMMPSDAQFQLQLQQCYLDGYALYGDLGLEFENYRIHIFSILDKYFSLEVLAASACCVLKSLFTDDLYLSAACSVVSERAWDRFALIYRPVIVDFARKACRTHDLAAEVAADVLANMFLPDESGRSRIASFNGRCRLSAWLRVIVNHNATKECERKCNNLLSAECLRQMEDSAGIPLLERSLRSRTYGPFITEALRVAVLSLTASERKLLLLRYEEGLMVCEIAQEMRVSSAAISRRIRAAQRKLRDQTLAALKGKGLVQAAAVEECTTEILENAAYSVLALVKTSV